MLPVAYFNPIHKTVRKAEQHEATRAIDNGVDRHAGNSENNGNSTTRGETILNSEEEPIEMETITVTYADTHMTSAGTVDPLESSSSQPSAPKASDSKSVLDSLRNLRPPLLVPRRATYSGTRMGQATNSSGVRRRHLAVLTAILHRSLLQYDYVRAAKAWSMILRSESYGHSLDLRNGFRWGIGAEILLHWPNKAFQTRHRNNTVVETNSVILDKIVERGAAHFDKIRDYYERLTLQYPYNKAFPDSPGPLHFRYAVFSMRLYACTRSEIESADTSHSLSDHSNKEELQCAHEIADELDELMSSPPYSDSENFKNLKNMLDRWIADLRMANDDTYSIHASNIQSGRNDTIF